MSKYSDENVEDLIKLFNNNNISIQITLDAGKSPTVHATTGDKTSGDTILLALQEMKSKLFKKLDMQDEKYEVDLKVKDSVIILNKKTGSVIGEGVIININDFREPNMKYAVDVRGYDKDVLFFGEDDLILKDNGENGSILED